MATIEREAEATAPAPASGSARTSWAMRHRDDLVVAGIFTAARIWFMAVSGVRMDMVFLTFAPQLPDLGDLQHHLIQTVFYEHSQPPGYSFAVGLLRIISPFPDGITFQVVYLAMGLALALLVRRIAITIGLGRLATFAAVVLVVTNPGLAAIEFTASYDEPTTVMIAVLILAIARYASSASAKHLTVATVTGAAIVLTRTVFHPFWYLLLVAGLVAIRRPEITMRRLAAILILPGAVLLGGMIKNEVLYGVPYLSSLSGASLTKIAGAAARPAEREQLIADGTVSPLFGRPVFWGYSRYDSAMPPCTPDHPDVPVLANPVRPENGSPNLNYECLLPVYEQQGKDASAFIRKRPVRFIATEMTGAQMFFEPPLPIVFTPNQKHLHGAESFYEWNLFPSMRLQPLAYSEFAALRVLAFGGISFQPTALLLDLGAIVAGLFQVPRLLRGRRRTGGSAKRSAIAAWAAIGLTCAWVTAVGSLLEINENARYRLLVEPYLLLTLAWAIERIVTTLLRRRGRLVLQPSPAAEPNDRAADRVSAR